MYITSNSLKTTLNWFCNSQYEFLLLYAGGSSKFDYEMQNEFITYRHMINQQLGFMACFFHFIKQSYSKNPSPKDVLEDNVNGLYDLKIDPALFALPIFSNPAERFYSSLKPGIGIAATYETTKDICDFFGVPRYDLPATVLVHKPRTRCRMGDLTKQYKVFPIRKVEDFYSVLHPIKLANELRSDVSKKSLDEKEKIKAEYIKIFQEDLFVNDASGFIDAILSSDSDFPQLFLSMVRTFVEKKTLIDSIVSRIEAKVRENDFDVFISCKSDDYAIGEDVFNFLVSNGHKPFIASKSLREIGESKYGSVISAVIDICEHMVVVASDRLYLETSYVKSEWELFCNEVRLGHNNGNLITILKDDITDVNSLPIDIRNSQILAFSDYRSSLCYYLD